MKNVPRILKSNLAIISFTFLLIACSSSGADKESDTAEIKKTAIDIKLDDLTTPCECVNALSLIVDEMITIADGSPVTETPIDDLLSKLAEVEDYCMDTKDFSKSQAKECDGFDTLESRFDVVEDFIK